MKAFGVPVEKQLKINGSGFLVGPTACAKHVTLSGSLGVCLGHLGGLPARSVRGDDDEGGRASIQGLPFNRRALQDGLPSEGCPGIRRETPAVSLLIT